MISELLKRTIRRERDGGQALRAGEPAMQHRARYLEDGLREVVLELQFVWPGRVVECELAWLDDGLAAVLQHGARTALAQCNQDEILIRTRDHHPTKIGRAHV